MRNKNKCKMKHFLLILPQKWTKLNAKMQEKWWKMTRNNNKISKNSRLLSPCNLLSPPVTGLLSTSYWSGDNKTINPKKKIRFASLRTLSWSLLTLTNNLKQIAKTTIKNETQTITNVWTFTDAKIRGFRADSKKLARLLWELLRQGEVFATKWGDGIDLCRGWIRKSTWWRA